MVYTVFYKTSSFAGYCFLGKNSIHPKRYDVFSFKAFIAILVKIQICSFIEYNALVTICDEVKNIDISAEHKDILNYQFVSALYGKDIIKFNIDWFENLLEKMRNGEI